MFRDSFAGGRKGGLGVVKEACSYHGVLKVPYLLYLISGSHLVAVFISLQHKVEYQLGQLKPGLKLFFLSFLHLGK